MSVVRILELSVATFFAVCGLALSVYTIGTIIWWVGELTWRIPKGYIEWDLQIISITFIASTALFSCMFFVLTKIFLRGSASRRLILSAILTGLSGSGLFVFLMALLGAGLSQID